MWRPVGRVFAGLAAVCLLTALCFSLHLSLAPTGFLYLLIVVVQALTGGFSSAAIISVVAAAALEYFFTAPALSIRIADPLDAIALITYLVTALVISRLSSQAQSEARVAERNEKEMRLLYEAALHLLALDPEVAESRFLSVFQSVFGLSAACLFDANTATLQVVGASEEDLGGRTRAACVNGVDVENNPSNVYIRSFRAADTIKGAIGFEGVLVSSSVTGSLTVIAAMILERARAFRLKAEATATTDAEALRSAILDALAHEFKGPLATSLVAVDALVEASPLNEKQRELAELIEMQIARLDRLTGRLLGTARLDKADIRPRLVRTDLSQLLMEVIAAHRTGAIAVTPIVKLPSEPLEVLADRELLSLALVQLVDNAFKYAGPGCAITIVLSREGGEAAVRIQNSGSVISEADREHIFERFYRGQPVGERVPGSGLGLYVSRKIVVAHGGRLELEPAAASEDITTFCLRLNLVETRSSGVRRAG